MTPAELSTAVLTCLHAAVEAGELDVAVPAQVTIERPKNPEHGDYATNVALQLAKQAKRPPRQVAEVLAARLADVAGVKGVDVAGPGFLNITLEAASQGELARTIVEAGAAYGRNEATKGQRANLEFISANPTGPLHLGHTRWAALGDAIARVLEASGAEVTREFYVNDRGVQMDRFGASLMARAHGREVPEDGYHGAYVTELAEAIVAARPEILDLPEDEQLVAFREEGYARQLDEHRRDLDAFRTHFDVWASERALHETGGVEKAFARLREQGHVYEKDGATWLRTTDFGDDKDRVLVKADGELTYFASDTAYYVDKRSRGYDPTIYLLGADHHGYVGRLKAIAACAGDDPSSTIEVLIGQLVKILKGGQEVRLAKRTGNIVTLMDFVDMAGVDPVRYSLCRYPADSPLTLDIEEITKRTQDNPVFKVQYAHARTANIQKNAADVGIGLDTFDPALLDHPRDSDLLGALGDFPRAVATAAEFREPHRVARYLEELAGAYNRWYDTDACRVNPVGDAAITDANRTRAWLNAATKQVLANGLDLLGVSAPERM